MTEAQRLKAFKQELRTLLEKHQAAIGFSAPGGYRWHGLYEERMTVQFKEEVASGDRYARWGKGHLLAWGWSVLASDLKGGGK